MKRRTITDPREIEEIIRKCQVCHVAMANPEGDPYVVPMNFGFEDGVIYLHSAQSGKKTDILKKNPRVCIAFSTDYMLRAQSEQVACSYSMKYRSILAYGKVEFIGDPEEKTAVMNRVMRQYTSREFTYNPPSIREVCCYRIRVERFDGKAFGY
jgi:uncharacterized protein